MLIMPDHLWAILTIFQEAEGESYDGKIAVAEVILRRTQDKFMSDGTIVDTCLRAYQFSGWNSKSPNRVRSAKMADDLQPVKDCIAAWDEAVHGSNLTHGAVFYYNPKLVPERPAWADPDHYTVTIGHHDFFTA